VSGGNGKGVGLQQLLNVLLNKGRGVYPRVLFL